MTNENPVEEQHEATGYEFASTYTRQLTDTLYGMSDKVNFNCNQNKYTAAHTHQKLAAIWIR